MERLPFILPNFLRVCWVSERARENWGERLKRIVHAWRDMEWQSIAFGMRRCALTQIAEDSRAPLRKMCRSIALEAEPLNSSTTGYEMLIGLEGDVVQFRDSWKRNDHDDIGKLLGYPACCRAAYIDWLKNGYVLDPTWAIYAGNARDENQFVIDQPGRTGVHVLVRSLGVRPFPHLPCRYDCTESMEAAAQWRHLADRLGYSQERDWVDEILSWPAEWSALHGIAEIKLPILKFIARTDATAEKYVIQWTGQRVPRDAAQGVRFPYKENAGSVATASPAFQRGLVHIAGVAREG